MAPLGIEPNSLDGSLSTGCTATRVPKGGDELWLSIRVYVVVDQATAPSSNSQFTLFFFYPLSLLEREGIGLYSVYGEGTSPVII